MTRQKCAGKWCATLWAPGLQFSVSLNSQIFNFQDLRQIEISMYQKWPSKPPTLSRVVHVTFVMNICRVHLLQLHFQIQVEPCLNVCESVARLVACDDKICSAPSNKIEVHVFWCDVDGRNRPPITKASHDKPEWTLLHILHDDKQCFPDSVPTEPCVYRVALQRI